MKRFRCDLSRRSAWLVGLWVVLLLAALHGAGTVAHAADPFSLVQTVAGTEFDGAARAAVSPDDKSVYLASRHVPAGAQNRPPENGRDALTAFTRDPATAMVTLIASYENGVGGVDGLGFVTDLEVSPDATSVYVSSRAMTQPVSFGENTLVAFARDPLTGELTYVETHRGAGLGGPPDPFPPMAMNFSPDSRHLYVAGGTSRAVAVYQRNPATGQLSWLQTLEDGVGGVDGLTRPLGMLVSPDGKHVYVQSSYDLDTYLGGSIVVFSRDDDPMSPAFGQLTFVESTVPLLWGTPWTPEHISMSPDGSDLYALLPKNPLVVNSPAVIVTFGRDAMTGTLSQSHLEAETMGRMGCRWFSADGERVICGHDLFVRDLVDYPGRLLLGETLWQDSLSAPPTFNCSLIPGCCPLQCVFLHEQDFYSSFIDGQDKAFAVNGDLYVTHETDETRALRVFRSGCFDGELDPDEECDDRNFDSEDGCTTKCTVCGNGVVTPPEQCDDGNLVNGDGCQASCFDTPIADFMLKPLAPLKVKISAKADSATKRLKVPVKRVDKELFSYGFTLQVTDGTCPAGTVAGLPDFTPKDPDIQDSWGLVAGKSAKATVPLLLQQSAFTSHSALAPSRCWLEATVVNSGESLDPDPSNNSMPIELNVVDDHDGQSTSVHESVIRGVKGIQLGIGAGKPSATKKVKVTVDNADLGENPGDALTVSVSDGTCPPGTVGIADFDKNTIGEQNDVIVAGGGKASATLLVTAQASAFTTTSAKSPQRCTAEISVTGPTTPDPQPSNNVTRLLIDVIDKNDP
jgi:cysteine-rich repeat protein